MPTDSQILDTAISIRNVECALKRRFNTGHSILSYKATNIDRSKGLFSNILRVELMWSRSCQRLPKSLVLKVPCVRKVQAMWLEMGDEVQRMAENLKQLNFLRKVCCVFLFKHSFLLFRLAVVKLRLTKWSQEKECQ